MNRRYKCLIPPLLNQINLDLRQRSIQSLTCNVIDGSKMAMKLKQQIKNEIVQQVSKGGKPPSLCIVHYEHDREAKLFVKRLKRNCQFVGIATSIHKLSPKLNKSELHDVMVQLGYDRNSDAGVVALPIKESVGIDLIHRGLDMQKDIDGFGISYKKFLNNRVCYPPAKVAATLEILRNWSVNTALKTTLLHGNSRNLSVLKRMITEVTHQKSKECLKETVVIETNSQTPQNILKQFSLKADIIVTEVGIPKSITADMVKHGSYIIDLSQNLIPVEDGVMELVGDVDFEEVKQVVSGITPVRGGVGPLSLAMMCLHTLKASKTSKGKNTFFK